MVKLGTFAMPLHPPHRALHEILKENQDKIINADKLGFDYAYVGEHYSCTTEQIASPLIFIVSGPGGVGKGTIVNALVERDPRLWLSRSWTTRQQRQGESDTAYVFTDRDSFEQRIAANGFLEWTNFLGNYYGTPKPQPEPGRDVVLEIDWQGALQIKQLFAHAVLIFILPPSWDELLQRLKRRGVRDLAVAYVRGQAWIGGCVVGVERPEQLAENLRLFEQPPLTADTAAGSAGPHVRRTTSGRSSMAMSTRTPSARPVPATHASVSRSAARDAGCRKFTFAVSRLWFHERHARVEYVASALVLAGVLLVLLTG